MPKHQAGKMKLPLKFEEALSDLLKVKPPEPRKRPVRATQKRAASRKQ